MEQDPNNDKSKNLFKDQTPWNKGQKYEIQNLNTSKDESK